MAQDLAGSQGSGTAIDVGWTAQSVDEGRVEGAVAVVIDVLRATTTIASLLAAGAVRIWPVGAVDEARSLARTLSEEAQKTGAQRKVLLAGERKGLPPEGFDLGNSPLSFDRDMVKGSDVVLTTTNGTQAIERCRFADRLVTASFVNMGAVLQWLACEKPSSIYVACAGTEGRFSLDDALAAGCLIARYSAQVDSMLSDGALAAKALYERYAREIEEGLGQAAHAKTLRALGFGEDVRFACQVDVLDVIPLRRVGERVFIEDGGAL